MGGKRQCRGLCAHSGRGLCQGTGAHEGSSSAVPGAPQVRGRDGDPAQRSDKRCDLHKQPFLEDGGHLCQLAQKRACLPRSGPEVISRLPFVLQAKSSRCAHTRRKSGRRLPDITWVPVSGVPSLLPVHVSLSCLVTWGTAQPRPPAEPHAPGSPAYLVRCPAAWEEVAVIVAVQ